MSFNVSTQKIVGSAANLGGPIIGEIAGTAVGGPIGGIVGGVVGGLLGGLAKRVVNPGDGGVTTSSGDSHMEHGNAVRQPMA
jgi:hypothetical protein